MDLFKTGAQAQKRKRQTASKKAPYARPEAGVSSSDSRTASFDDGEDARSHKKPRTPLWKKRLERFVNPWRRESSDEEDEQEDDTLANPTDRDDENQDDENQDDKDAANLEKNQAADPIPMEVEHITKVITEEVDTQVTVISENGTVTTAKEDSQTTLVALSLENTFTPEGSIVDDVEDQEETRRQMEREESLLSGQDSDTVIDRKEPKRTRRKRESRSSTPVRSTRRTTRSQAAQVEQDVQVEQDANPNESTASHLPATSNDATQDPEDASEEEAPASTVESSVTLAAGDEQLESVKSKGGKKKRKSKKKKTPVTGEVEELEQELVESGERIAEKIQQSQELIDASEDLLEQSNQLDEATVEALEDSKGPFSDAPESGEDEDEDSRAIGEEDDQTFHSTTQFEPTENENDESEEQQDQSIDYEETKYYPPEDEEEEESADTVRYYPPEPPSIEGNEDSVQGSIGEDETDERTQKDEREEIPVEDLQAAYYIDSADDREKSPSPPAAEYVPESRLFDFMEIEFSPMQSRSPSAAPEIATPSSKEHFVDCPPIMTPKAERTKHTTPLQWDQDMHPTYNITVLAAFFEEHRGQLLTPHEAEYCHRLIDDSVMPYRKDRWHNGEDGVSFRDPVSTPVKSVIADAFASDPIAVGPSTSTTKANQHSAPFAIKRRPSGDLYRDRKEPTPRTQPISSEEYLEIKKYEGVEWEDLPKHVKIKRFLEWKGTESPEVVKRRRIETRRLQKERNAEIWDKDKKQDISLAMPMTEKVPSIKRTVSASGMLSDDDEEHSTYKTAAAVAKAPSPVSTISSAVPAATSATVESTVAAKESTPKPSSSVAQKLLQIVGKSTEPEDGVVNEIKASSATFPAPSIALASSTPAKPPMSSGASSSAVSSYSASLPSQAAQPVSFPKSATQTTAALTTSTSAFSFATPAKPTSEAAPSIVSTAPAPGIDSTFKPLLFGAAAAGASTALGSAAVFSFSTPKTDGAESSKPTPPSFSFSAPKADAASPSKSAPKADVEGSLKSGPSGFFFGAPKVDATEPSKPSLPSFSFAVPKTDAFEPPKSAPPAFTFSTPKSDVTLPSKSASPSFNFGAHITPSSTPTATAPSFGAMHGSPSSPTADKDGSKASSAPFKSAAPGFGSTPVSQSFPKPPAFGSGFVFGQTSATTPTFGFGATSASSSDSPQRSSGQTFGFGIPAGLSSVASQAPAAKPTFGFGIPTASGAGASEKPAIKSTFNFGVPSESRSGFGPTQVSSSFGQSVKTSPSASAFTAASISSSSAFGASSNDKAEGMATVSSPAIVVLSDGEDDEDDRSRSNDDREAEDDEQEPYSEGDSPSGDDHFEDNQSGEEYIYGENGEEITINDGVDYEDEDAYDEYDQEDEEERDGGDSGHRNEEADESLESARSPEDLDTSSGRGSSQPEAAESSQSTSFRSFRPTSGFTFGQISETKPTQSSSFVSSGPVITSSQQTLKSPGFAIDSSRQLFSGSSSFTQSTSTTLPSSSAAFGANAFGSSSPSFGFDAITDTPSFSAFSRLQEPRASISEFEVAPIIMEEEGFYTEEGTISPLGSPVLSPAGSP
ncbi:hypothetical protein BGZ54_001907 [Gamsiella multidivaricata]|nr:hypothetical protein BGZ54_001907 [Gamsiella multidivaricata]